MYYIAYDIPIDQVNTSVLISVLQVYLVLFVIVFIIIRFRFLHQDHYRSRDYRDNYP